MIKQCHFKTNIIQHQFLLNWGNVVVNCCNSKRSSALILGIFLSVCFSHARGLGIGILYTNLMNIILIHSISPGFHWKHNSGIYDVI